MYTTPQHLDAMRLQKTLTAAQQDPPKRPLRKDHAESPPPADKDFDNPFSMLFLSDLWQTISKAGLSGRYMQFRAI
jgi:hypothetical protein